MSTPIYSTIALIVAAGSGSRTACPVPKQYLPLQQVPMLRHSILALQQHAAIDAVVVVYQSKDDTYYQQAIDGLTLLPPVQGGTTRQESVYLGLQAIAKYSPQYVFIHDAARPLIPTSLLDRLSLEISSTHGVIPVLAIEDTLRNEQGTIDRSHMLRVQTPQGFPFASILAAHEKAAHDPAAFTDDASLYEALDHSIKMIAGSPINLKITTADDFMLADHYLNSVHSASFTFPETRTGLGYDVHAFGPAQSDPNTIMMCGVAVPHPRSLVGHSDADVGLHALTDALLASIALDDIGAHFSDQDQQYKNRDSSYFVTVAHKHVKEAKGKVVHVDITIIGERPKISPHRVAMRTRVAEILNIDISRVSVKATTTEKLGFTGREEGLAAQAIVSVQFP